MCACPCCCCSHCWDTDTPFRIGSVTKVWVVVVGVVLLCCRSPLYSTASLTTSTTPPHHPAPPQMFTSLMLMKLSEQGLLDPQTPLATALPGFAIGNPFGGEGPTLDLLSAHMGGMPRGTRCVGVGWGGV